MNLPNKITLLRLFLIPIMVIFSVIPSFNQEFLFWHVTLGQLISAIIFIIASLTDFLDGYIARKYNLITTFGKFADPLADKILVVSAFLLTICYPKYLNTFYLYQIIIGVIIILFREFMVSGIRMISKTVIAAKLLGKIKTAVTMITIILMFFDGFYLYSLLGFKYDYFSISLFWSSVLLTIISGANYLVNFISEIKTEKNKVNN